MYGRGKVGFLFQTLYIAQISHPPVDVFQIEHLENGIVAHIAIEGIHYGAFVDYGISDVLPLLKHHLG